MAKKQQKQATKEDVLHAFLEETAFDGWGDTALANAVERLGLDENYAYVYFPNGVDDVLDTFHEVINQRFVTAAEAEQPALDTMRIRDRIKRLVLLRLETLSPHKNSLSGMFKHYGKSLDVLSASKHTWHAAHLMWKLAGDTSTDYNHYTKRALLSGVYASTVLFWLNDTSPDHQKTDAFLESRIDNVMQIESAKRAIQQSLKNIVPFGTS